MHVTYDLAPQRVDDNVRFRTTYYFRTFDYCWDANPIVSQVSSSDPQFKDKGLPYQRIIPQTDTLYRYRMTGKANALFNRIRFESGVLKANAIDPFGSQVTYSSDADGFFIRSNSEVKELAERTERARLQRIADLDAIDTLIAQYNKLDEVKDKALRDAILPKIVAAIDSYLSRAGSSQTQAELADVKKALEAVQATLVETNKSVALAVKNQDAQQKTLDAILAKADVVVSVAKAVTEINRLGDCPIGDRIRKGFQIMGPEGLKTFDQDDRLIMAMSNSASPLIETLNEYSGRLLSARVDPTRQLLAIAEETSRTETARRAVADARAIKSDPATVLGAALDAFKGDAR